MTSYGLSEVVLLSGGAHDIIVTSTMAASMYRGVARIFGGGVPRGGVPRSAKEANNPNKRAAELKPRPCAHQGSMFRP